MDEEKYNIRVTVDTVYVEEQSDPETDRYVFAYTITIENSGSITAQLLNRHWTETTTSIISDGTPERSKMVIGLPVTGIRKSREIRSDITSSTSIDENMKLKRLSLVSESRRY